MVRKIAGLFLHPEEGRSPIHLEGHYEQDVPVSYRWRPDNLGVSSVLRFAPEDVFGCTDALLLAIVRDRLQKRPLGDKPMPPSLVKAIANVEAALLYVSELDVKAATDITKP